MGAIKNVGFEAISQVVQEREKNGKFRSIGDFINRVDPKNINKLQLEGLVKACAFDSIFKNRKVLYDNIPNIIQNSKTIHENKINNQSSLFLEDNHKISYEMINYAELEKKPELVRTMSAKPPKINKKIRLVKIGNIDLQPCGGTHVNNTSEIGYIIIEKIENKGKINRRINISISD